MARKKFKQAAESRQQAETTEGTENTGESAIPSAPAAGGVGFFDIANPWPEGSIIVYESGIENELIEVDLESEIITLGRIDTGFRSSVEINDWNNPETGLSQDVEEVRYPKDSEPGTRNREPGTRDSQLAIRDSSQPPKAEAVLVPIDKIDESHNIRETCDDGFLLQLQESLKDVGLLQPVVVRKVGKGFRLIAGHQRLEAAKRNGEEFIQAKVYAGDGVDDTWEAKVRLAENVQRKDLNHIELADVLGQAADAGMSIKEISEQSHLSDDSVRRHLALRRLARPVAELVASGRLPVHQGELISRVGDTARQISLAENTTRLAWDSKAGKWTASGGYDWRAQKNKPASTEQDVDDRDFILPMDQLRRDVAHAMCGLAACGWPMDEDYAGKRACRGCPDNTLSYADQPMLFAGIRPQGSAKKGHCTNPECYQAKKKSWDKVLEKRRGEKAKAQKAAIAKAKKAGLDVCEDCGKVITQKDPRMKHVTKGMLCSKCAIREDKKSSIGQHDDYQARQKKNNELRKKFPETPQQRLAVAMWKHLENCVAAVGQAIASLKPDMIVQRIVEAVLLSAVEYGNDFSNSMTLPTLKGLADGSESFSPAALAAIWLESNELPDWQAPGVDSHDGKINNVPLSKEFMTALDETEVFGRAIGAAIPPRPNELGIVTAQFRADVLTASRSDLPGVLEKILIKPEKDALKQMLVDATAGGVILRGKLVKLPKWRVKAIMDTLGVEETLQAAHDADKAHGEKIGDLIPPGICPNPNCESNGLRNRILQGRKADALAAIAEAGLVELQACDAIGPKGDWRRAAIGKRIALLKKQNNS